MSYPGAWDAASRGAAGGGPTAAPGRYSVRLSVADAAGGAPWTATKPLILKEDPRNARDGVTLADLRAQFDHNIRVRDLVSEVNRAVATIQSAKRRLQGAQSSGASDTLSKLVALEAKLVTPPIRYSKPGLQEHIRYLNSLTNGADQKVGRDAIERYAVLKRELDAYVAELKSIVGAEATNAGGR
jgi:hypothetical protein